MRNWLMTLLHAEPGMPLKSDTRKKQLKGQVRKPYCLHSTGAQLCKLAPSPSPVLSSNKSLPNLHLNVS